MLYCRFVLQEDKFSTGGWNSNMFTNSCTRPFVFSWGSKVVPSFKSAVDETLVFNVQIMYYRLCLPVVPLLSAKKEPYNRRHTVHVPADNRTSAYCSTIQTIAFTTRTLKSSVSISASCSTYVAIWPWDRTNASRLLEAALIHVWNWKILRLFWYLYHPYVTITL